MKVDFGDFQFLRIEPAVVRYVSGVATALLGSGGLYITTDLFSYLDFLMFSNFKFLLCFILLHHQFHMS